MKPSPILPEKGHQWQPRASYLLIKDFLQTGGRQNINCHSYWYHSGGSSQDNLHAKTKHPDLKVQLKFYLVADDIIIHMENHRMQRWNEAFHVEEYHEEWQNKGKEVQDIAEWNQRAKMKETSMVCEAWYEEGLPSPNRLVYTLHTISTEPHLECMHTEKLIWNPHGTTGVLQQPQQPWGKGSTCTSNAS